MLFNIASWGTCSGPVRDDTSPDYTQDKWTCPFTTTHTGSNTGTFVTSISSLLLAYWYCKVPLFLQIIMICAVITAVVIIFRQELTNTSKWRQSAPSKWTPTSSMVIILPLRVIEGGGGGGALSGLFFDDHFLFGNFVGEDWAGVWKVVLNF
jgi:hypothetical protein